MVIRPELLALLPNMKDLEFEIIQIVVLACIIPVITFFGLLVQHKLK